jgi:cell division septum initiation protein DivIVA
MSDTQDFGVLHEQQPDIGRFGDLGERLARAFGTSGRASAVAVGEPPAAEDATMTVAVARRFPLVWRGYDRYTVEQRIDDLENELSTLSAELAAVGTVPGEIDRLANETAAILRVAHEQAESVTAAAQVDADRLIADAHIQAQAVTRAAEQKLRQLDADTDAVWAERARLLEDVRRLAGALGTLTGDALQRFPPEAEQPTQATVQIQAVPEQDQALGDPQARANGVVDPDAA